MRQRRDAYRVFGGETKEKLPLGRPRIRWEYNIKMDPQEEGKNMDCVDLAQNRDK
jgi:hypothetical protein